MKKEKDDEENDNLLTTVLAGKYKERLKARFLIEKSRRLGKCNSINACENCNGPTQ